MPRRSYRTRLKSRITSASLAFVLPLVTGCSVGPDYTPPQLAVPDVWEQRAEQDVAAAESPLETWWTAFGDPLLNDLIEYAGESNLDLHVAAARVYEARAVRGIVTGDRVPQLFFRGGVAREQLSESLVPEELALGTTYNLGLSFTWEVDVFGRIDRSVEAATAQLDASVEDYRDVMVVLYAAIAGTYVDVRELQTRIEYALANVEAQRSSLRLTRSRASIGLSSGVDVAQAESNVANTEARIPSLRLSLEFSINRLAVLLGLSPGTSSASFRGCCPPTPSPHRPQRKQSVCLPTFSGGVRTCDARSAISQRRPPVSGLPPPTSIRRSRSPAGWAWRPEVVGMCFRAKA